MLFDCKETGHQSLKICCRGVFTDRDHGEGFVLSENRAASRAGKRKHIETYGVYPAGNRCVESPLFGMSKDIRHVTNKL